MPPIRFFTQADNQSAAKEVRTKKTAKLISLTGYVSATGKLVLPTKTLQAINESGTLQAMKVGSPSGKRTVTVLYLVPTDEQDTEGFPLVAAAKGATIDLGQILHDGRIKYKAEKYDFTLTPFTYEAGVTGYELELTTRSSKPKVPYTGKPRGHKPKGK